MEKAAFRIHDDVNQKYDHVLPYGFHLKMTVSYVSRYGYLVAETEADILILYASAFLHDTIEDARMKKDETGENGRMTCIIKEYGRLNSLLL